MKTKVITSQLGRETEKLPRFTLMGKVCYIAGMPAARGGYVSSSEIWIHTFLHIPDLLKATSLECK